MHPDRGCRSMRADEQINLQEIRWPKQPHSPIRLYKISPGTPHSTSLLHGILSIHEPSIYAYISAMSTSNITHVISPTQALSSPSEFYHCSLIQFDSHFPIWFESPFIIQFDSPFLFYLIHLKKLHTTEKGHVQYTRYPSTARGSSLAVNDRTLDVQITSDRPSTP